ncbi:acyl-homoserine-lactone synthase [Novosphingobium terrae]|uniref:acyl-homoserine-lactone synthase n=1 Tax=Novosphingobium terrae TaxID=2726189 RepID=UPI00197EA107|nr:acyl-homoserine-lactone synthase [Novosphingobium terrae]
MFHVLHYTSNWRSDPILRSMFEARKRVFIDLLKWDLPVLEDSYEVDRFDEPGAIYLVLSDADGNHRASTRLLPTGRPHLLDTLFPDLCGARPPKGPDTWEITRFCLDRNLRASDRLTARNELVSAMADYALAFGIRTYTGVAEIGWFRQIEAFGWNCRALEGLALKQDQTLTGLRIDITEETPSLLKVTGIYQRHDRSEGVRHAA